MADPAARDILSRSEAADYLRISVRHLDRLAQSGEVEAAPIDGRIVYLRADLLRYVEECKTRRRREEAERRRLMDEKVQARRIRAVTGGKK